MTWMQPFAQSGGPPLSAPSDRDHVSTNRSTLFHLVILVRYVVRDPQTPLLVKLCIPALKSDLCADDSHMFSTFLPISYLLFRHLSQRRLSQRAITRVIIRLEETACTHEPNLESMVSKILAGFLWAQLWGTRVEMGLKTSHESDTPKILLPIYCLWSAHHITEAA